MALTCHKTRQVKAMPVKTSVKVAERRASLLAVSGLLNRQSSGLGLWVWGEESKSKKLT